ncbi:MAG TPA: hypothetical protein DCG75_11745 [Bacteroidales bacterium]|nr:hypothetical protein [Bacteroidales bacterium]
MFDYFKLFLKKLLPKQMKKVLVKMHLELKNFKFWLILQLLKDRAFIKSLTQVIIANKYGIRKFVNIEFINTKYPEKMQYIFKQQTPLFYSPPKFNSLKCENNRLTKVNDHHNYVGILNDTVITGGSNLIILDSQNVLYDLKKYDLNHRFKYNDEGLIFYKKDFCLIKNKDSNTSFKAAIFMGGNFSWNYYHLLYEILIKFEQIDALNLDSNIPILVDKICFEVPQYFELFAILNKKERKLIPLQKSEQYRINKLYYFSSPNFIPPNFINENDIRPEDILFDINSLEYLRNNLRPHSSKKVFPKRLYISRSKASGRRQFNELDVFKILEKYDFETILPENYSIPDQISMFSNAEYIVGGSGAAFTNLIYCKKNCKVIIFAKNELSFSGFSTISSFVGNELIYFTEEKYSKDLNIHAPFIIDTIKFDKFLTEWISL